MKHYHLSLRRIAKNYQSTNRRSQPATLAATLLLGFYEVWNSDHDKWCKHMWGARPFLKEIPLKQMNRDILALRRSRRQRWQELHQQQPNGMPYPNLEISDMEIDTAFMSQLTGRSVSYDSYGQIYGSPASPRQYTERDLENFENLRDLYWWYCKMDVYQSVLGGQAIVREPSHPATCKSRCITDEPPLTRIFEQQHGLRPVDPVCS